VDAVAVSLDHGDVGVVGELVEQGSDRGGVGEDGVPVAEGEVGGEGDGLLLVAAIDDLVEQVGGVVVVGEVSDLVDDQEPPEMRGLRGGAAGGVQLQGPGLLPVVHRTADERDGRKPDRAGAAAAKRALASGC
jgi:hypothetical protein